MTEERCPLCHSADLPQNKPSYMAWYIAPTREVAAPVYMCCQNCRDYTQIWAASPGGRRVYLCGEYYDAVPTILPEDAIVINAIVSGAAINDKDLDAMLKPEN